MSEFPISKIKSRFPKVGEESVLPEPLQDITVQKFPKSSVDFESPAKGMDKCCKCFHFAFPSCYLIDGKVGPNDWCNKFKLDKNRKGLYENEKDEDGYEADEKENGY